MGVVYRRCAGLDVHKKSVVVCRVTPNGSGGFRKDIRKFGTMTEDLLALSDWLRQGEVKQIAMESTGVYWKPVFNVLEGECAVILVNAEHIKHVPGRKTDINDAQWIAELLQHGLLKGSYIPEVEQRDLRDLTRYRTSLIQEARAGNQPGAESIGGCQHQVGVGCQQCAGSFRAGDGGGHRSRRG